MSLQKRIFTCLKIFMGVLVVAMALMAMTIPNAGAEPRVLRYKTYHPETGEITNRFSCVMRTESVDGYEIDWTIEEGGLITNEQYKLNKNFETMVWKVMDDQAEPTNYIGIQRNGVLYLDGVFKGAMINKKISIAGRPFYYNPKLGLSGFVLSGKKEGKFWGFQNRELKTYPMKAIRKGIEQITVHGEKVEAVKVYWTVDGFGSAFFKRVYWFRPSDGLYLKQKSDGGRYRELVSEE